MINQRTVDSPSYDGQFGWERVGSNEQAVPVIIRNNGIRYSPVRIVEQEIIKKYDSLPQNVFQCITLKSFYLTAVEAKLLNNINFNHCNAFYGDAFFSPRDVIISAADVKELSHFLDISQEIFRNDIKNVTQCGVIRFFLAPQNQSLKLLVPYITKILQGKSMRFIPSKMVEKYVAVDPTTVKTLPTDWDVMYLKMLSIHCENNSHQHINRNNQLIQLDGLNYIKTNIPILYESN